MNFSTWTILVWWRCSTDRSPNKFAQHAGHQKQRLDGSHKVRLVARGFEQTVSSDTCFYAGTPKLTTLRALLSIAEIHGNPVDFGDCQSAFHLSPMPSESEPVYVEPAPEAQLDSSKVWLCKKAFQGLNISPQACSIHITAHRKSTT